MTEVKSSVRVSAIAHAVRSTARGLGLLAAVVAPPVLRLALATPFFRSGLTRWDGFLSLSPRTIYFFENEFQLHVFGGVSPRSRPPILFLVAAAEITLPAGAKRAPPPGLLHLGRTIARASRAFAPGWRRDRAAKGQRRRGSQMAHKQSAPGPVTPVEAERRPV